MACAIAEGRSFWGRRCSRGSVLYLDLESKDYRVKSRLKAANLRGTDNLHFVFSAANLGYGLLEQLSAWVAQHPDTNTIIIDTLGRVKGFPSRNTDAYTADTATLAPLQAWALQNNVAVICVTHLRKAGATRYEADSDPFERITGSNAQFGVADTAWIITGKRDDAERHFIASGRDIEAVDLAITFDRNRMRWKCLGDAELRQRDNARLEYDSNPIVKTIRELLEGDSGSELRISSGDLCDETVLRHGSAGCTPSGMGKRLAILSDKLYLYDRIIHDPPTSGGGNKGRLHKFRYEQSSSIKTEQIGLAV